MPQARKNLYIKSDGSRASSGFHEHALPEVGVLREEQESNVSDSTNSKPRIIVLLG